MSKHSSSTEGERERKARQRAVPPPVMSHPLYASATPYVTLQRNKGRTPEESGYPEGQVDVRTGPQGQKLWRLNGSYSMPNNILCFKA